MLPFAPAVSVIATLAAVVLAVPSASSAFDLAAASRFQAVVDADQEVADPPVDSKAHGHVSVVVDEEAGTFQVKVVVTNLSGPAIGAHLHLGAEGTNGPIVVDLSSAIVQQGQNVVKIDVTLRAPAVTGPLASEPDRIGTLLRRLSTSGIYFNVHTRDFPAGEARGQL